MASNKLKDKAADKAKARERAKARKTQEIAQLTPPPEWSAEFREELTRLFGEINVEIDAQRLADILAELERSLFRERMTPKEAAREASRAVDDLQRTRSTTPDPEAIQFSIQEEGGSKLIIFTHFRVRVTPSANGKTMDYVLDGLEGCDTGVFNDIVRVAQEARDGELYLHATAAYEWWRLNKGTRPTFQQLATMARHLRKNEKFTTRLYL